MNARRDLSGQPAVTVATLVVDDGRLLCVEETAAGALVINQPAGHLDPGESLADGAVRETLEETGWTVRLTHLVGVYQWTAEDGQPFLRFAFAAVPVSHDPARPLDRGIERALWLTPAQLRQAQARHRSPLVARTVEDFLAGRRYPLDLVTYLP
ncbi:NUDIX hydrolase [Luteimonas yindakuii]|uniref:Phosphatase NudJ n=1 Tax=Luteimonas yindakuii TaxID=2565782 RepID=A0A4Z1R2X4_9GAMM|nr:NUDIX hydrolase [Luteimonas yindakuii]TKS54004.1 NUDIX hydrolase [Luteimonas yindakuii]